MRKIIPIMALVLILGVFFTYALDCGFVNPVTNGKMYNTTVVNITYNLGNATETLFQISINASSPSIRNSSTLTFITGINNQSGQGGVLSPTGAVNFTFNNSGQVILDDAPDYTFVASIRNVSGIGILQCETQCNSSITGIEVDRSNPSAPTGITFTNPLKSGDTITSTITRADAYQCFVRFGSSNAPRNAMVLSGTTCTFTVATNSPSNGDYVAFLENSDGTNSTSVQASGTMTVRSAVSGGGGLSGQVISQITQGANPSISNPLLPKKDNSGNAILVFALFVLAFLYIKHKK